MFISFGQIDAQTYILSHLEGLTLDIVRDLPDEADPEGNEKAHGRLYQDPTGGITADPEINQEWKEYIQPDLEHLFLTAVQTVRRDLESLQEVQLIAYTDDTNNTDLMAEDDPAEIASDSQNTQEKPEDKEDEEHPTYHAVKIPRTHFDAWLSCMNQARLVIFEKNGFSEEDMEEDLMVADPENPRDMALVKLRFYAGLQEMLIDTLRHEMGDEDYSKPEDIDPPDEEDDRFQ